MWFLMMLIGFILMIISFGYLLNDWISRNEKITKAVRVALLVFILGLSLVLSSMLIGPPLAITV